MFNDAGIFIDGRTRMILDCFIRWGKPVDETNADAVEFAVMKYEDWASDPDF